MIEVSLVDLLPATCRTRAIPTGSRVHIVKTPYNVFVGKRTGTIVKIKGQRTNMTKLTVVDLTDLPFFVILAATIHVHFIPNDN